MSESRKRQLTRAQAPHAPAEWEVADASAMQALERGVAEPDQQKRALDWIIRMAAGTYEFQFYPSDRETAFGLGRAFVGQQIVKLLRVNTASMRRV